MKRLKKMLRLFGLMLFLLLAIGGVSLTGAAPTPPKNRSIINTETAIKKNDEEEDESPAGEAFYP
jgi:CHASE3 domain sensor protein